MSTSSATRVTLLRRETARLAAENARLTTDLAEARDLLDAFHAGFQRKMLDISARCGDMLTRHVNVGA